MKFENFEQYKSMRDSLIAEAEALLNKADKDGYKAKVAEVEKLDSEFENYRAEQANLNALKNKGVKLPANLENMKGIEKMNNEPTKKIDENVYHDAFFNFLRGEQLEGEELIAFNTRNGFGMENAFSTTTEAAALPVQTLDKIWDLCEEQHSILEDIDLRRTGVIIKVVKRTAITAGKGAKKSGENVANTTMEDTKIEVELSGNDYAATVELSYAAAKMSISALEDFIVKDIAEQVGWAMASDTISTIEKSMNVGNKLTAASGTEFTFVEIAKVFGMCKRVRNLCVYTSNTSLYNYLVGMVDTNGRPIFQNTAQEGANGALIGAKIRLESAVSDGKILVGDPMRVIGNVVQDIMVETDRDIKTHTVIYSAYARMQAELIDDQSFASLELGA
ncbi:MAG: phage major capsid protein [Acutalibacteraceae bacterium]|nr:phage major capsid protein [Acutalibacteraceae bacterium]